MKYKYEEFELEVCSKNEQTAEVQVQRSCHGRPSAPFLDPLELAPVKELLDMMVQPPSKRVNNDSQRLARQVGAALYQILFPGDVEDVFEKNLLSATSRKATGLRVRLSFRNGHEHLAGAVTCPWELVYQSKQQRFLGRCIKIPIVRYLDAYSEVRKVRVRKRIRVLLVAPAPKDMGDLNLAEERRVIQAALRGQKCSINVTPLVRPTLAELRDRLLRETFHVVHFIGHGGFNAEKGKGGLFFENGAGTSDMVLGEIFAEHLADASDLRLVVLNSCSTGALPRVNGQDPFSGVASALIMAGIPAVVAMQFPISNAAAIAFSNRFYRMLGNGRPLEAAVAEGRLGIFEQDRKSLEWITPVLYLRSQDGQLLDVTASAEPLPVRLGIRSLDGIGEGLEDETDDFLGLQDYFDGRYVRQAELWGSKIYPELRQFLDAHASENCPLHINLAAHASIAFAAGYYLEPKRNVDVTLRQRGAGNASLDWHLRETAGEKGADWQLTNLEIDPSVQGVAMAIGITAPVLEDVKYYLKRKGISVRRILGFTLPPGQVGQLAIRGVTHARHLVEVLIAQFRAQPAEEQEGTTHLFVAAPNAFTFLLGQLAARPLRRVRFYEYDFDTRAPGAYEPSLEFPLPAAGGGG